MSTGQVAQIARARRSERRHGQEKQRVIMGRPRLFFSLRMKLAVVWRPRRSFRLVSVTSRSYSTTKLGPEKLRGRGGGKTIGGIYQPRTPPCVSSPSPDARLIRPDSLMETIIGSLWDDVLWWFLLACFVRPTRDCWKSKQVAWHMHGVFFSIHPASIWIRSTLRKHERLAGNF